MSESRGFQQGNQNQETQIKMKMTKKLAMLPAMVVGSALSVYSLSNTASAANLLLNPGFEVAGGGGATDADGWNEVVGGPTGTVTRGTVMPAVGSGHAFIDFTNGAPGPGGAYFIEQNQGANTIDNGLNYDFSFFAKTDTTDFTGVNIFYQVQWLDQDGSDGGGFKGGVETSITGDLTSSYQEFSANNIDVPDGADSFLIRFQISAGAVDNISANLYVDSVSLDVTQVPEPSSSALLGLGGLALVLRRRK